MPSKLVPVSRSRILILARVMQGPYPPTVRELCRLVKAASTNSVAQHLTRLKKQGYIRRDPFKARSYVAKCRWIPADEL